MHRTRAGRRSLVLRLVLSSALAALLFVQAMPPAMATTVGIINGTITDTTTHAPLANVRVTAAATTGSYTATSNARGFYSMTGVYADTYTVSFQRDGYEPVSQPGVNVFADQVQTINVAMAQRLKQIAQVTSRSNTGAFQPNQTVDTYTVTAQQANQFIGNNINLSESQLIAALPGASLDSSGYPVIRGGRENEENFQFEGIPYTDAFTNQFVNTLALPGLGLQSAQLTPGVANAAYSNSGTGTLNLVVKRGTYPGFASAQVAAGFPGFRHAANLEFGIASPDGRFSDYMTFAGSNQTFTYGGNTGVEAGTVGEFFGTRMEDDREYINNLVYRFGRDRQQSLQLFLDLADHHFYGGYGGFNQFCFRSCDPRYTDLAAAFSGMTPDQVTAVTPLDPFQNSQTETLGQANRPPYTYFQPNSAYKIQYTNNFNSSTYLSAMLYHVNAVTTFDFPLSSGYSPFAFTSVLQQGGSTNGGKVDLNKQLSDKHLLRLGGMYQYLRPVFDEPWTNEGVWNTIFSPNGEYLDFLPDDANCPFGPGVCGYLATQGVPAGTRIPPSYETSRATRQDMSFYVNDTWTPNSRLTADLGLRMDGANYRMPAAVINPATCEFYYLPSNYSAPGPAGPNAFGVPVGTTGIAYPGNCGTASFDVGNDKLKPRIVEPVVAASYKVGQNDVFRAAYGRSVELPFLGIVDFYGGEEYYTGGFGKIPSFSAFGSGLPNGVATSCGIFGNTVCQNYGQQLFWDNQNITLGIPFQPVRPTIFNNYDLSWEHQFTRGRLNGVQLKLTPWLRKAYDEVALTSTPKIVDGKVVTDPATGAVVYNPPVASNAGYNRADGIEFQLTRQVQQGLSAQFTATYINEVSSVVPLSSSEDFFPSIPAASLAVNNIYRVGYVSPFQTTLALNYQTKNGWRINPVLRYNVGYPIGAGLLGAAFVNGTAYNIPNTNYSAGTIGSPVGGALFIDPMNPGSVFAPNVAATRGTPETASPGGKLSHENTIADLTVEYAPTAKVTIGATVQNIFNSLYSGPSLNARYQPVATGISGPLTGQQRNTFVTGLGPAFGFYNYGLNRHGNEPYINTPNDTGRQFYVYVTTKL